jgi:hypothetical protein
VLKSTVSKKKRAVRSNIDMQSFVAVKKLLHEPLEEIIHDFEYPADKLYL